MVPFKGRWMLYYEAGGPSCALLAEKMQDRAPLTVAAVEVHQDHVGFAMKTAMHAFDVGFDAQDGVAVAGQTFAEDIQARLVDEKHGLHAPQGLRSHGWVSLTSAWRALPLDASRDGVCAWYRKCRRLA